MSEGFICRNSGDGYATINFNTYTGVVHESLTSSSRALTEGRASLAATNVGDYALFGGGYSVVNSDTVRSDVVDAYNTNLTRTTPTSLSEARYYLSATTVGDYALFGGGYNRVAVSTVDAYNASLTRTTPTSLSKERLYLSATAVGDYALFAGGTSSSNIVDAYNASLVHTTPTSLSEVKDKLAATRVEGDKSQGKDYALFGGGNASASGSNTVDSYNASLVHTTPTSLSEARYYLSATSVKTYYKSLSPSGGFYNEYYAIFAGGYNDSKQSSTVDAYNVSLTRLTPSNLSEARSLLASSMTSSYAFFGGGRNNSSGYSSVVDIYDESFLRYSAPNFIEVKRELSATNIGNYVLFGGGYSLSNGYLSTVEHYTVDNIFQVFPETKYKFSGMSSEQTSSSIKTVTVKPPISGYIKVKTTNIS